MKKEEQAFYIREIIHGFRITERMHKFKTEEERNKAFKRMVGRGLIHLTKM